MRSLKKHQGLAEGDARRDNLDDLFVARGRQPEQLDLAAEGQVETSRRITLFEQRVTLVETHAHGVIGDPPQLIFAKIGKQITASEFFDHVSDPTADVFGCEQGARLPPDIKNARICCKIMPRNRTDLFTLPRKTVPAVRTGQLPYAGLSRHGPGRKPAGPRRPSTGCRPGS